MRTFFLASAIFSIGAFAALAQADQTDLDSSRADELQRSLEAKAVRIPRSSLAAALSAPSGGRSDKETTRRFRPDWNAVREDLDRTAAEDGDNEGSSDETTLPTGEIRRLPGPLSPRPGLRARAPEQMQRVARAEVDGVTIPVLTPANPEVRDKLKMYGQPNAFTASGAIDDAAMVSISGACDRVVGGAPPVRDLRRRLSERLPTLPGLRADYQISRSEFSTDLTFAKFGCGYVISIECTDADADERCTGDDYIIKLAQSMWVLNAERAGESE
ncbi:MAG: hypothetical protein HKN14_08515 [Marinicaulis sp.]|nr:hypothetical protein [Marinicaulis sp.]